MLTKHHFPRLLPDTEASPAQNLPWEQQLLLTPQIHPSLNLEVADQPYWRKMGKCLLFSAFEKMGITYFFSLP